MKKLAKHVLLSLLAIALGVSPVSRTWAQEAAAAKPAVVISITSLEKLLTDFDVLTNMAGVGAQLAPFRFMAEGLTAGLDKTRPAGTYVVIGSDGQPAVVGFLPVKDLQTLLGAFKNRIGEPEDAGGGVLKLTGAGPQPLFLKEQGGWALLSNAAAQLSAVPQDPSQLLAGLDKQYDIAVRGYVQNIPAGLREAAVEQVKAGMEIALQQQRLAGGAKAVAPEVSENLSRNMFQSLEMFFKEADQITVGWGVDGGARSTYLEFALSAIPGTALAKQMTEVQNVTSAFAGFLLPEAAATLHAASRLNKDDIEQLTMMVKIIRDKALTELDNDQSLDDEQVRQTAKEVLGTSLDVLSATVREGTMDGGAALLLGEKSVAFAAGFHVADGAALEGAFRKLVDIAKGEPQFPGVNFDADMQGDVRFHTMNVPVPEGEEQARQLLGDHLEVALGFGPKSIYLAFGKDNLAVIKKAMDKSSAGANEARPAAQLDVALGPVMKFAASIEANPVTEALSAALEQSGGKDHVKIESRVTDQGATSRLEIQEGVLGLIGKAIQMAGVGGPPPANP